MMIVIVTTKLMAKVMMTCKGNVKDDGDRNDSSDADNDDI